ncbi:unnamed protein product [Lactuca virosa]|uniref:Uncharacterized protein n=1 Tax=Lactuca virosa TaxID=75947 RepID=A0AAU9N8A0_9ASTR|nr:unnamed protein product [Lactuca virosa]
MLEEIRIYLMNRFYHQAAIVSQWKGDYGPNTLEKIKEFGKHMRFCIVIPSGGALFETRHGYSAYTVDLDAHSCSCRLWEISRNQVLHPVPKRKNGRPRGDGGGNPTVNITKTPRKVGEGKKKVVEGTSKEENEVKKKDVDDTSKEASEGKMKAAEGTSKEAGKMIDVDQSISPLKRMRMMARRGGKIKYVGRIGVVHGSLSQTMAGVDEVVLTCHEKLGHEDFETIKDLQASGYDLGEIVEAFNKLIKERKEMLVESIVDEETSQETQDPLVRKRKPSKRIIKIKLKKQCMIQMEVVQQLRKHLHWTDVVMDGGLIGHKSFDSPFCESIF